MSSVQLKFHSDLVLFFLWIRLTNFLKTAAHRKYKMASTQPTRLNINPITSKECSWAKFNSRAAERKCGAPLCLSTYSVQYTALSNGDSNWSRNIIESFLAVSAKLNNYSIFKKYESNY